MGTEQTDGDADNLAYSSTYDKWSVAANASGIAVVRFTFSSAIGVSVCAIAAHNLGDLGATVEWQYSTNGGSTWNDSGAGTTSPSDNQAIIWHFTEVTAADWRLRVTGAGASSIVNVGVAFVSYSLIAPTNFYQGYAPPLTPTRVELQPNMTEGGEFVGSSTIRKGSGATAEFTLADPATLRGAGWLNFQRHFNGGGPFFFAWRPEKYGDAYYAKRGGATIAPTNSGPKDYMSFAMEMDFYDQE